MAVAAFWIALAAVLIASSWRRKHVEQMRHQTVRLLIEKGATLDDGQIGNLLNPPHPPLPEGHPLFAKREPGHGYRTLRIFGTILMIVAPGIAVAMWAFGVATPEPGQRAMLVSGGPGLGVLVFLLGVALFYASRFLPRPPDSADPKFRVD